MFRHEYPLRVNALIYQSECPWARYLSTNCSRMFTVLKSVFGSLWSQTHNMKTIMWYKFKIISNNSQKILNFLRSMCFLHHITKYIFYYFIIFDASGKTMSQKQILMIFTFTTFELIWVFLLIFSNRNLLTTSLFRKTREKRFDCFLIIFGRHFFTNCRHFVQGQINSTQQTYFSVLDMVYLKCHWWDRTCPPILEWPLNFHTFQSLVSLIKSSKQCIWHCGSIM